MDEGLVAAGPVAERLMVVSSDGHAGAEMDDYREYLDPEHREAFDRFVVAYWALAGGRSTDLKTISMKFDDDVVERWKRDYLDRGRLDGYSDPGRRLVEIDGDGVSAELLFPDFAVPFAPFAPSVAALSAVGSTPEQLVAGFRAYNRWLVDFCAAAPERFAGQVAVSFRDPGVAVADIRWAKEHGLVGVVFVMSPDDKLLYDEAYDPIWSTAEELGMPVNFHVGISSGVPSYAGSTQHPATARALSGSGVMDVGHHILSVLIWGGVMERHPRLTFVFTEQHSDWVIAHLARMDHSYDNGTLRHYGIRDVCPLRPGEYFERQCFLGSSIFSRGEIRARHRIGLDKIMLGMDYPHFEGTWRHETREYLRATVGAEQVPEAEVRMLLGETLVRVFGLDATKLSPIAARVGPTYSDLLAPPAPSFEISGDVVRPLVTTG